MRRTNKHLMVRPQKVTVFAAVFHLGYSKWENLQKELASDTRRTGMYERRNHRQIGSLTIVGASPPPLVSIGANVAVGGGAEGVIVIRRAHGNFVADNCRTRPGTGIRGRTDIDHTGRSRASSFYLGDPGTSVSKLYRKLAIGHDLRITVPLYDWTSKKRRGQVNLGMGRTSSRILPPSESMMS